MHILSQGSVLVIVVAFGLVVVQPKSASAVTYNVSCWIDPKRCTEFVCPDECPTQYDGNPNVNLTCNIDCYSPNCEAQCYDWNKYVQVIKCKNLASRCYGKLIPCPAECPEAHPSEYETDKACYVDCNSRHCQAKCRYWKPSCDTLGSSCYDPRFVGGDGIVFYFHGKTKESFNLVSDVDLQINGRFTGHRPTGRPRDFTWIEALGILFNNHKFSLEATKAATWDNQVDHLKFTYDGEDIILPQKFLSMWLSPDANIKVQRVSSKNNVIVTLKDKAEILVNVVPVTKEDDRIHHYQMPSNDCFVHLEVQYKFFYLSSQVDGVLGRTYRPDFENPAQPGVAMPILGGEEKFRTTALLSADCESCVFSPGIASESGIPVLLNYATFDCTKSASGRRGIVCKR